MKQVLCVLLVLVLALSVACSPADQNGTASGTASGTPEGSSTPDTPSDSGATQPEADPATAPPEDTPRSDAAWRTTTDLVLPAYTYDAASGDLNNDGIHPATRDVFPDTWVFVDGAGRVRSTDTGIPTERQVGIFYFLWRDQDQTLLNPIPASDHYAAYREGGINRLYEVMQEGGEGHPHYWAEPYFGYYSSNDEWVLRKHGYMLADAGVDFVFFDTTNGNLHTVSHMALLRVWEQMRTEGVNVPKVVFLCGGFDSEFQELYRSIYEPGLYEDLWYYWNGKPLLMLSGNVNMTDEQSDFFTVRYSWAYSVTGWYADRGGKACWPWADTVPQHKGKAEDGTLEQMVVMCGFWATNTANGRVAGRSFSKRREPTGAGDWDFGFSLMDSTTGLGLAFAEQFEYALSKEPPLIMITGWNEWIAGRWSGGGAGSAGAGQIMAGEYTISADPDSLRSTYFVDCFNPEFSRDIEPMKGGFGDNYLWQMTDYVYRYKGARTPESAFGQWAIDLSGSLGQWFAVGPEYRDYEGDVTHRNAPGHVGGEQNGFYINTSGRNDLVTAKVSSDSRYLYFYMECADDITAPEGENWMNLFLNTDGDLTTGWHGFDFILNRSRTDGKLSVEAFSGTDEWAFTSVGQAEWALSGRVIQIKVERALVNFTGTVDFKWADNSVPTGDPMEFLDQGDTAPNGRASYRFTLEAGTAVVVPACLTQDMVVLKAGSYNAYADGKAVRLVDDNTHGVLLASDHELYLPAAFLESVGIRTAGAAQIDHYGIPYVHANELIEQAGKTVTVCANGLIVLADAAVTDTTVLDVLYRSLQ